MSLFRSEDMELFEITIPKDNAWDIMNELGSLNCMHFIDLNKQEQVFNLTFAPIIKRCEETERRIAFLENECKRYKIKMKRPRDVSSFLDTISKVIKSKKKAANLFFEEIEKDLIGKEKFV